MIARDSVENERVGIKKDKLMKATTEITLTGDEIAQNMIKWKPYLAYVDNLISKALIQAASSRYLVSLNIYIKLIHCLLIDY